MQTQPHNSLECVFLYGKAGAGKDTQAGLLRTDDSSALIISTGDIVRAKREIPQVSEAIRSSLRPQERR